MRSRSTSRRAARSLFAATALSAGVLAGMAADQLFAAQPVPPSPLGRDEEFVVKLSGPVSVNRIAGGGITVTAAPGSGAFGPNGSFVAGKALIDSAHGRAVVVRPEALREFFVLERGLDRADADVAARRLLDRVDRTGDVRPLDKIDVELRTLLGPAAGTRLDDPNVFAAYPAQLAAGSPLMPYRRLVAGDDALWRSYLLEGEINAYSQLTQTPDFERFFHPIDEVTGNPSATSVLRQREHRRVLMRRTRNVFTFAPDIPTRPDLTDSGFSAGGTYDVKAARPLRGITKSILPARGGALRFVKGLAELHVAADTGDGGLFLGGLPWTGSPPADAPRVVNVTPPNGESFLDRTTDWEDPDNQFTVPMPQRRPFVVRMRFSRPLDPRTVDAAHFTLTKVAVLDVFDNATPVSVPVTVGVTLFQRRMGEVVVEIVPSTNLDPQSRFEVRALDTVKSLDGTPLGVSFVSSFQ